MNIRHIIIILIFTVFSAAIFSVRPASTAYPRLSSPVDAEDHREATERSRQLLADLLAQGNGAYQVEVEIVFVEPFPIAELQPLVGEYHLGVTQLKARFPGFDQTLSAGYIIQPGQSLDEAITKFGSYQEPYMREAILQIKSVLTYSAHTPEERQARERQLVEMYAFQQSLDRDGVRLSSIRASGSVEALMQLLDRAPHQAVVAVIGS